MLTFREAGAEDNLAGVADQRGLLGSAGSVLRLLAPSARGFASWQRAWGVAV